MSKHHPSCSEGPSLPTTTVTLPPSRYRRASRGWVKLPRACHGSVVPPGPLLTLVSLGDYVRMTQWRAQRPVDAVHPGADRVAAMRGIDERTARRHLKTLVDLGLLQLVTAGGRGMFHREKPASQVSRRACKRVELAGGRVRYASAMANAYQLTALGWAAAQGHSLPDELVDRIPVDGRRKRRTTSSPAPVAPALSGGQNAPPDTSRMDVDFNVYERARASAPRDPSAAAPDRSRAPHAPATASLTAPAAPYAAPKAALERKADRPPTARPATAQARPATLSRAVGVDAHGALARLQRAVGGLPPPATSTRPPPASILRAADPPPRPPAGAPQPGTPAWYVMVAERAAARQAAREGSPPTSTATRDPAPPPRDPAWGALADELARRGGTR